MLRTLHYFCPAVSTWRLLDFDNIDPQAWDACVHASGTALPYGYHTWLYATAIDHWQGLVLASDHGVYEAVMPLSQEYKALLLPHSPMPPFTQQLGVFARPGIAWHGHGLVEAVRPVRQKNLVMSYAAAQPLLFLMPAGCWQPRRNLVLPPAPSAQRHAQYSKGLLSNLKKAAGLEVQAAPGAGNTSRIFNQHVRHRAGVPEVHMGRFTRLSLMPNPHYSWLHLLVPNGHQILDPMAAASFVITSTRMVYLMGASSPLGRERGAMPLLLDHALDYAHNHQLTFDFEGGNLAGAATFFRMFGPQEETYYAGHSKAWL